MQPGAVPPHCGLSHLCHNSAGVGALFSSRLNPTIYTVEEVIKGRLLFVRAQLNLSHHKYNKLRICDSEDFLLVGGNFNSSQDDTLDRNH